MTSTQTSLVTETEGRRLWSTWIGMWNGDIAASAVVGADFRIRFAGDLPGTDDIRGPVAFQAFITASHMKQEKPTFVSAGSPAVSADHAGGHASGQVVSRWNRHLGNRIEGGIDMLAFVDGRVVMAWSVTGKRAWPDESTSGA